MVQPLSSVGVNAYVPTGTSRKTFINPLEALTNISFCLQLRILTCISLTAIQTSPSFLIFSGEK